MENFKTARTEEGRETKMLVPTVNHGKPTSLEESSARIEQLTEQLESIGRRINDLAGQD